MKEHYDEPQVRRDSSCGLHRYALASVRAQPPSAEAQVRQAVQAFYAAFNSPNGFERAADFATEDWNHINPFGGRTDGRPAVLKEVLEAHRTFLKGVSDTVTQIDVRMATPDVGVATVASEILDRSPRRACKIVGWPSPAHPATTPLRGRQRRGQARFPAKSIREDSANPTTLHALVDQRCRGRRLLSSTGIVEEEAREWRAPVLKHPNECAVRELWRDVLLE
jgi:ketosteroid isomerase-like protein